MNTIRSSVFAPPMTRPVTRPIHLRWSIWSEQQRTGHEPCFGTERRMLCEEMNCPWRGECLSLRAEWRR